MDETINKKDSFDIAKILFERYGWIIGFILGGLWSYGLWGIDSDMHQGQVYRILYVHVPCAFVCFACAFFLAVQGIYSLIKPNSKANFIGKALAEIGLVLTVLTLVTGSIWARPTWGVWWSWDARLTTTFILAILYAAYLILWSCVYQNILRTKLCAVLGLIIAIDVPIIYKSVSWWRTLHQPPSMFIESQVMDPKIIQLVMLCASFSLLLAAWMVYLRYKNLVYKQMLITRAISSF